MAVLGVAALAALKGYLWVQAGETWKAALMGIGVAAALTAGGWLWHRWKRARKRVYDPLIIREKVSRIAFDGELQLVAVLPGMSDQKQARERARMLLEPVAAAYRHYDHPAGGAVQSEQGPTHRTRPIDDAPHRPRTVRQAQRPGRPGGGGPVAPAGGRGRDASGGAVRGKGADALGQGSPGGSSGGTDHGGQAPYHPLPRRPAQTPPPLRGKDPHGQVHTDAPHRRPQDDGEGCGKGRRRHRRRRSPRRPGGRPAPARAGVPHRPGAPHRPGRQTGRARRQPAGRPHLRRPRPHRRLGGSHRQGSVGPVGAEDAVHPRADRQDPPRGQRAPRHGRRRAADHPGRADPAGRRQVQERRADQGERPLLAPVVGEGLQGLARRDQSRRPGPGADPPLLLRILQAGQGHPGPAPIHHRHETGRPRRRHPAGLHRPGSRGQGRGLPGGRIPPEPGGRRDTGAGEPAAGAGGAARWSW